MNSDEQPAGPDGQFAIARDIFSAPSSPDAIRHAFGLMEAASATGCGPASEMLALFEALGTVRSPSWSRAFDLLQLAAEQGSQSAAGQLRLLAEREQKGIDWRKIRASISTERLFRHGPAIPFSESPRIRVIEQFLTGPECRWLIDLARPRLSRATVIDSAGAQDIADVRSNSATAFQVVDMDVVFEIVRARIADAVRMPVPFFEPTQILHYAPGEEFRPHHDYLDPANDSHGRELARGQRIGTFLVYLNDDFEGGETDFPVARLRYRGGTGDAIFWTNVDARGNPDVATLHSGLPPATGEKWILSQWIRDRAAAAGAPA
jgi:hypothetical protein